MTVSEGRITLHGVSTEVSERSQEDSAAISDTSIPAIEINCADTNLEILSGGSMVPEGLIKPQTEAAIRDLSGMLQLPEIGTPARCRDVVNICAIGDEWNRI